MEYDGSTLTDLDAFYSKNVISLWKQVIGDDLHYHFGDFSDTEDPAEALRQTVRNFYDDIPSGSRVLDAGCGWGAPAGLLVKEHGCNVTGITISSTQAEYCRNLGLNVFHLNLEDFEPEATFETVLFLESFEHVIEKARLLKRLQPRCRQIIISSNAWGDGSAIYRPTFGMSSAVSTPLELCALLRHCGYEVKSIRDRRPQSLPTLRYWKENFDRLGERAQFDSQLRVLKDYTNRITASPARLQEFEQNAPLVDIVARSSSANGGSST